jgi:hypothetical protein
VIDDRNGRAGGRRIDLHYSTAGTLAIPAGVRYFVEEPFGSVVPRWSAWQA